MRKIDELREIITSLKKPGAKKVGKIPGELKNDLAEAFLKSNYRLEDFAAYVGISRATLQTSTTEFLRRNKLSLRRKKLSRTPIEQLATDVYDSTLTDFNDRLIRLEMRDSPSFRYVNFTFGVCFLLSVWAFALFFLDVVM